MRFALTSLVALVLLPCSASAVQERGRSDDEKKERQAKAQKQVEKAVAKQQRAAAAEQREQVRKQRAGAREQQRERRQESRRKVEKAAPAEPSRFGRREKRDERAEEWSSLLRNVKRRRPELAGRLNELLKKNPKRFEDVVMQALMRQIEESLGRQERRDRERADRAPRRGSERGRAERRPRPPREPAQAQRPQRPPGRRPAAEPRVEIRREAFTRRLADLRRRNDDSEIESRELATELRRRIRGGEGPRGPERMRAHLRKTVGEHFELRSELRRLDLVRIETELARLQEAVNRLRSELELRSHERRGIIERRIRQLIEDKD